MIGDPPSKPGTKPTVPTPMPAVVPTIVGAPGVARGVPEAGSLIAPVPMALVARSSMSTATPLVRPGITIGCPVPATGTQLPPSTRYW